MLAVVVLRIFTLLAKLGMDTTSIRFSASFAAQNKWKKYLLTGAKGPHIWYNVYVEEEGSSSGSQPRRKS